MGKMKLKAGDEITAYFCPDGEAPTADRMTVRGFSVLGIYFTSGDWWHWSTERNWYGFGYHKDGHILYILYYWHLPYACVFEKVRLEKYSEIKIFRRNRVWKRRDISDFMVLKAYERYRSTEFKGEFPYDFIIEVTGAPFKVVWRAIERTHDRGYLDYGTSLRTAWITDKGKQFISSQ